MTLIYDSIISPPQYSVTIQSTDGALSLLPQVLLQLLQTGALGQLVEVHHQPHQFVLLLVLVQRILYEREHFPDGLAICYLPDALQQLVSIVTIHTWTFLARVLHYILYPLPAELKVFLQGLSGCSWVACFDHHQKMTQKLTQLARIHHDLFNRVISEYSNKLFGKVP